MAIALDFRVRILVADSRNSWCTHVAAKRRVVRAVNCIVKAESVGSVSLGC